MAPTKQKIEAQLEDLYPLSPSQKGMLLDVIAHTQDQTTEKYLEVFLIDMMGNLDLPAFRQTWQTVIQRHTALRTGFLWKNQAEPLQFVLKQASIDLTYLDWRAFSSTEQQQQQAYLQDLTARGLPMQAQYFLGVHLPAAWIGGIVLLGWGLNSTYIIGYIVFFTSLGIAFRPIWRQERLEAKQVLPATVNDKVHSASEIT